MNEPSFKSLLPLAAADAMVPFPFPSFTEVNRHLLFTLIVTYSVTPCQEFQSKFTLAQTKPYTIE